MWFLRSLLFYSIFSWCWKIEGKPKIFAKVIWIFWYLQHISLTLKKSTRRSQSCNFGKFFNIETYQARYPHQDFEIHFCLTLFNINVYLCVSFRAVDIVTPKDKELFKPKILMMVTNTFFFVWEFGCLEDWQKPVKTSLSRNRQKLLFTETRTAQP